MTQPPEEFSGEATLEDIVQERIRASYERLMTASRNFADEDNASAVNRAYYAVFKAMIAVHAMDHHQFKRHKDAIAQFNKTYVANDVFPRKYGRAIHELEKLRNVSDYADFKTPNREQTRKAIDFAREFLHAAKAYCEEKLNIKISLPCLARVDE